MLTQEFRLDLTHIFTHCSRELAKLGRLKDIRVLISHLSGEGLVTDAMVDEIVGASLLVLANSNSQGKDDSDTLVQMLRNDSNKVNLLKRTISKLEKIFF